VPFFCGYVKKYKSRNARTVIADNPMCTAFLTCGFVEQYQKNDKNSTAAIRFLWSY